MFQALQNASKVVAVGLASSLDGASPVIGKGTADVTCAFAKADGTVATYAPSTLTFTQLTTGAFAGQGLYQLTIPSAVTSVVGPLVGIVTVTGALPFRILCDVVGNFASDIYARQGAPAGASMSADAAAIKAELDLAGTAAALATVSTAVTAVKAKTDNLPSDPADESMIEAAIIAAASPLATSAALTTVGSDVTAIKAKTDPLPTDPGDESMIEAAISALGSGVATAAALATLSTAVAAVKAQTDTLVSRRKLDKTAKQLTFFALDGVTPAYVFNSLDASGAPTSGDPFELVPVGGG